LVNLYSEAVAGRPTGINLYAVVKLGLSLSMACVLTFRY